MITTSHPKRLACSAAAIGVWVTGGSWSAHHLTDGFIPKPCLPDELTRHILATISNPRSSGVERT